MTVKSDVTSIAGTIGERVEALSAQVGHVQEKISGWDKHARRLLRERPGTVLIGAVVFGFVLARIGRHA